MYKGKRCSSILLGIQSVCEGSWFMYRNVLDCSSVYDESYLKLSGVLGEETDKTITNTIKIT